MGYPRCVITLYAFDSSDKGKVERTIRNVTEEFINLLRKFPEWIDRLPDYRRWYNRCRFHRGINACPAELYPASI
ncbi:MAG: hypothetical protein ACK4GQ_03625 [Candidatus Hadarchaeales archaeon]